MTIVRLSVTRFSPRSQILYYLLVLQPGGLDTCMRHSSHYRLHIELVTALRSGAKIIPVTVDFTWPSPETIPEDIRAITSFNGVRWIHDYQVHKFSEIYLSLIIKCFIAFVSGCMY